MLQFLLRQYTSKLVPPATQCYDQPMEPPTTLEMPPNYCQRCRVPADLCYCERIPVFTAVQTRLVILMHVCEAKRMSNTANLAREIFPESCEIRVVGALGAPLALDDLLTESAAAYYLFPWNNAAELTRESASTLPRPLTLIVPDGSWAQARRIKIRNQELHGIPSLRLPPAAPARYRLRRQSQPAHLCTLEAVARALSVIEGFDYQSPVEELLSVVNERILTLRGAFKKQHTPAAQ